MAGLVVSTKVVRLSQFPRLYHWPHRNQYRWAQSLPIQTSAFDQGLVLVQVGIVEVVGTTVEVAGIAEVEAIDTVEAEAQHIQHTPTVVVGKQVFAP